MSRHADYRFVLKNYTQEEIDAIKAWDCRYLVIGYEVSTLNLVPNIQGYVYWNFPQKFDAVCKLNENISWRACNMSPEANRFDCINNSEDVFEKGNCPVRTQSVAINNKRKFRDIMYLNPDGSWSVVPLTEVFPTPPPMFDECFNRL